MRSRRGWGRSRSDISYLKRLFSKATDRKHYVPSFLTFTTLILKFRGTLAFKFQGFAEAAKLWIPGTGIFSLGEQRKRRKKTEGTYYDECCC
jgi:hypothetical protein